MSRTQRHKRLVRGDLVVVRSAVEIEATLDEQGTLNGLPFMPEMVWAIGRQFRVSRRVEHFSFDGDDVCGDESSVRHFPGDDVVVLEGLRCNGAAHSDCKRGCTLFWREAWLRPTETNDHVETRPAESTLQIQLPVLQSDNPELYFCQSSELLRATRPVSGVQRLTRCLRNVVSANYGPLEMLRNIVVWLSVRGREKLQGPYPTGRLSKTPAGKLDLQVGELVEVKSLEEIKATLDQRGHNRGLHFAPEMIPYCGKRLRVLAKADQMIMEGTGKMRSMKNTVILENAVCDSATWAFGACPREDYIYWREIWLKRVETPSEMTHEKVMVS